MSYPNVACGRPGHPPEPGYIICVHVLAGRSLSEQVRATPEDLGRVVCSVCSASEEHDEDDFHLVCAVCARKHGWVVPREWAKDA